MQRGGRDPDFRGRFILDVEPLFDHMTSECVIRIRQTELKIIIKSQLTPILISSSLLTLLLFYLSLNVNSDEHAELKEEVAKLQKDVAEAERNSQLLLRNAQVREVGGIQRMSAAQRWTPLCIYRTMMQCLTHASMRYRKRLRRNASISPRRLSRATRRSRSWR